MAAECGFFNASPDSVQSGSPDRVYLAEQFAKYFALFVGNGVYANTASELQVAASDVPDMNVKVRSGAAWINGYWYRDADDKTLSIPVADGTAPRIDIIVLKWDKNQRDIHLAVKSGTPASSPQAPALQRDEEAYEIQLAAITVARGATNIQQSAIKDTRPDTSLCGWVKGLIDQIDTTDLFAQYEAAFEEYYDSATKEFEEWYQSIKDILPDDVAIPISSDDIDDIWNGQ